MLFFRRFRQAGQKTATGRTGRRPGRLRPQVELLEDRQAPAVFPVNTPLDTLAADLSTGHDAAGLVSLRSALQAANAQPGADTIILPAGHFLLQRAGAEEDMAETGDLDVRDTLVIRGAGPDKTFVDANGLDRVFQVFGRDLHLEGVTITGGQASQGGGIEVDGGNLTARDCRFTHNQATAGSGGALFFAGQTLVLQDCLFSNNTATQDGLDLFFQAAGDVLSPPVALFVQNQPAEYYSAIYDDLQAGAPAEAGPTIPASGPMLLPQAGYCAGTPKEQGEADAATIQAAAEAAGETPASAASAESNDADDLEPAADLPLESESPEEDVVPEPRSTAMTDCPNGYQQTSIKPAWACGLFAPVAWAFRRGGLGRRPARVRAGRRQLVWYSARQKAPTRAPPSGTAGQVARSGNLKHSPQ